MIHLICLRCNRANASEAKFCCECGAGLLRKFCGRCHAINDAESHFCQSCGEALPGQPSVPPAPPMAPPAVVPDLTDVYADFDDAPPQVAEPLPHAEQTVDPPAALPVVVSEPTWTVPVVSQSSHRTVLFGFVGGAAVLLAALLWSRGEHSGTPPVDAPMSAAPAAPAIGTPASAAEVVAVPVPAPAPPQASKAPERRLAPDALIAAQPPAAGPAPRSATQERRPATRSVPPPSPALECTPQVDALGLCAPGAKVADKSGSR